MKKIYLIILNIIFISFSFSQEIPILPTKENKIYYVFNSIHHNKKKCLRLYQSGFSDLEMNKIINQKLKGRYDKLYDGDDLVTCGFIDLKMGTNNLVCLDTIKSGKFQFILPEKFSVFDNTLIGAINNTLINTKPLLTIIKAEPYLVYLSNNQVEFRLRKFIFEQTLIDGTIKYIDLSEYYSKLKEKEKINKKEMYLFKELDDIVKFTHEAFDESIKFIYENEELD